VEMGEGGSRCLGGSPERSQTQHAGSGHAAYIGARGLHPVFPLLTSAATIIVVGLAGRRRWLRFDSDAVSNDSSLWSGR
jgi:hypothetical protein